MTWVCDECYSEMKVEKESENRNRVYCEACGNEWYIDDEDEYINDNSLPLEDYDYDDDFLKVNLTDDFGKHLLYWNDEKMLLGYEFIKKKNRHIQLILKMV